MVEVYELKKYFAVRKTGQWSAKSVLKAVDNVSFTVRMGETLGIVGESGSGKSTLVRCLTRLIEPTSGKVVLDGEEITKYRKRDLRKVSKNVQMVFQDPVSSLNPRMNVLSIISEPLSAHEKISKTERKSLVVDLLKEVGLNEEHMYKYPGELSGGQCQRVAIARALSIKPKILILDEPTASLDVSVQAQVLELLEKLQKEYSLTYLFVSHDIAVVRNISHKAMVMYLGKVMEIGPTEKVVNEPLHPYTKVLMRSVPIPDPDSVLTEPAIQGEPPSALNPPSGCPFRTRCPDAVDECSLADMTLKEVEEDRYSACILNQRRSDS